MDPADDTSETTEWDDTAPAPPPWLYPLIGEIASEFALLEFYTIAYALRLTSRAVPPRADVLAVMADNKLMRKEFKAAAGLGQFDTLLADYKSMKEYRDRIAHSVLWWQDSNGFGPDFFSLEHARTKASYPLATSEEQLMRDALAQTNQFGRAAFLLAEK